MLIIPTAIAETRTYSAVLVVDNATWRNQLLVHYNANEFTALRGGEGVSFYIDYSCDNDLATYNKAYPSHQIKNITLKFIYSPMQTLANGTTYSLDQINKTIVLTNLSMPFPSLKEFFTIYDKETVLTIMDTEYLGYGALNRDSICRFDVVLGTEGCDKCREVEYYDFVENVNERNTIQTYNTNIKNRIGQFFGIHYEFALILYYISLITIFLFAVSVLIYGTFWLFHIIKHFFGGK